MCGGRNSVLWYRFIGGLQYNYTSKCSNYCSKKHLRVYKETGRWPPPKVTNRRRKTY